MKWKWTLLSGVVSAALLSGCGAEDSGSSSDAEGADSGDSGTSSEEYTIGVSHTIPETGSTHLGMEEFKKIVEEDTNGQVTVEIYPNGQLYSSEREAIEAVQSNNIEMTVTASAPVAGFNPKFAVLDLPFLFPDHETAYEALDGDFGQSLLDELPESGLRGLAYGETGMRQITNNSGPIETPEDLKGVKIRTMENDVHISTFEEFGADASPFAFGELYSALQQNTYDAMENPINLIDQMKFYEVQDYLTISNHAYTATVAFMNDDFYTSMPEELQTAVSDAAKEALNYQRDLARQQDEEGLEVVEENMEINELSEEQRQEFIDAAEPVYESVADDLGEDLVEEARSFSE
ncbi:DctP family TRAP transporter solute-binding subunit [Salibacterium aidingense]|uniref:DctP family TRAP transporter solute-binding subunit n=1 Tax=Salibacterium aidingense TaxID=384933 RepID=UPI0003F9600C|nr:DctP family TRAP transporter solute-binding subunit [Salibacterium aidingense]